MQNQRDKKKEPLREREVQTQKDTETKKVERLRETEKGTEKVRARQRDR